MRKSLATASILLLSTTLIAGPALAAPTPTPSTAAPSHATTKRMVDDDDGPLHAERVRGSIEYLRSTFGISEQEALARLELQRQATAARIELPQRYADEYSGSWLDQHRGLFVIAAKSPDRLAEFIKSFPGRARTEVVDHARSMVELQAIMTDVARHVDVTPAGDHTVAIDEQANAVAVYRRDRRAGSERLADLVDRHRGAVTLRDLDLPGRREQFEKPVGASQGSRPAARPAGPPFKGHCFPAECPRPPMRGGIRLDVTRDDGTLGGCTNGFNVWGNKNAWAYTMTAAHCITGNNHDNLDLTQHNGVGVGVEDWRLRGVQYPTDFAIMPYQTKNGNMANHWIYNTSDWSMVNSFCQPYLYKCTNGAFVINGKHHGYDTIGQWWIVCATGSGTDRADYPQYVHTDTGKGYAPGTRCGAVVDKDGGVKTDICSRKGDSGGPLFSEVDSYAYGILSDGTAEKGRCKDGERSWYSPVSKILSYANTATQNSVDFRIM